MVQKRIDLTGHKYGRLTVLSHFSDSLWNCKCDCGAFTVVRSDLLRSKKRPTRSCGCLQKEIVSQYCSTHKKTHGETKTRLYRIWRGIKTRCFNASNSAYPHYGGRGITMCDRWKNSYEAFKEDMLEGYSDGLEIDRIDNDGNYCKENCRWSTRKEQVTNRRSVILYEFEGESHSLKEWARIKGFTYGCLRRRVVKNKWPIEKALTEPLRKNQFG